MSSKYTSIYVYCEDFDYSDSEVLECIRVLIRSAYECGFQYVFLYTGEYYSTARLY